MSRRGSGPVAPAFHACHGPAPGARSSRHGQAGRFPRYLFGTLIAASICISVAQAATFGHSRIVSALGQPLHLEIPVTQLTQQEINSLTASPAPAEAWREAGMTPPVALDSMRLVLLDGYRPDVKVIQLRSDQVFDQPIVDVLLDVRSVSGQQRYQVSLLAHADPHTLQRAGGEGARNPRIIDGRDETAQPGSHVAAGRQIAVRSGDNMFAIARRNAVQGVTVYQMMIALQRTNPQAFIEDNVNLVKAGANLTMPDMDVLTALSDREARRIFQQHAQAFARYRQRSGGADVATLSTIGSAAQGGVSEAPPAVAAPDSAMAPANSGDRLRLSGGPETSAAAQSVGGPDDAASPWAGGGTAGRSPAGQGGGSGADASPAAGPRNGSAADTVAATGVQGGSGAGSQNGSAASTVAAAGAQDKAQGDARRGATQPGVTAAQSGNGGTVAASFLNGSAGNGSAGNGSAGNGSSSNSAGVQAGAAVEHAPPVSLLASSGAIASDAVSDKEPIAVAGDVATGGLKVFGSDATSGGTVLNAGTGSGHPDDQAAMKKGVGESQKRVLELEDNVRHLNEALQKQGHVAAEAALEGARSVSEAIKEVMSLVDPDKDLEKSVGQADADGVSSGEPGSLEPAKSAGDAGNGAASTAGASPTPAGPPGQSSGAASAPSNALGSGAAAQSRIGQEGALSPSTSPVRTEKKVSWLQENMLAVIGGGLTLIVLIVVWLLRRASAARQDIFESDSPITDSMLHDRLREIDLDLDAPPSGGAGPRAS